MDPKQIDALYELAKRVQPIQSARIVAALYRRNTLVGIGFNQRKSHPLQARYSDRPARIYLHAEIAALVSACHRHPPTELAGLHMVVVRAKEGGWGLAKPCKGCMRALYHYKLEKVTYTTNNQSTKTLYLQENQS